MIGASGEQTCAGRNAVVRLDQVCLRELLAQMLSEASSFSQRPMRIRQTKIGADECEPASQKWSGGNNKSAKVQNNSGFNHNSLATNPEYAVSRSAAGLPVAALPIHSGSAVCTGCIRSMVRPTGDVSRNPRAAAINGSQATPMTADPRPRHGSDTERDAIHRRQIRPSDPPGLAGAGTARQPTRLPAGEDNCCAGRSIAIESERPRPQLQ